MTQPSPRLLATALNAQLRGAQPSALIDAPDPSFAVGDRVEIINPHDPAHSTGVISIVSAEVSYGVLVDGMESMGVHKWYADSELAAAPGEAGAGADSGDAEAKKKKPMKPMKMSAERRSPAITSGLQPLLRVQALASGDAELLIYGPIGESWWDESTSARAVVDQLATITASTIQVRINSEGGSVVDGLAIYNALKRHGARIVVTVDGLAASIASLIAMAGDEVVMPANTLMMVHAPWAYTGGNADDLRQAIAMLETYEQAMASSYAAKTGKPDADILTLLRDYGDHYYTAAQAVEFGFADRALTSAAPEPADEAATAALLASLIHNVSLTASAPPAVCAHLRSRLSAALTPKRFASLPEARQTAIVASIGDDEMKKKYLSIMAQVVPVAAAAQPGDAPAAAPNAAATGDAGQQALAAVQARNTSLRSVFAGFRDLAGVASLESEVLADMAVTVEQAQARLLGVVGAGAAPLNGGGRIEAGVDEADRVRAAGTSYLLARAGTITGAEADTARQGNPFANLSLIGMAEQSLIRAGINTRNLTRDQIAQHALAAQTTSDFTIILENTLNRMVLAGYGATPFTWRRFCSTGTLSDYRPHNRYHLSSFSDLKPVNEAGEYENGVLGDGIKEVIQGARKGRILQITPEVLVNDDLGALSRPAGALGQAAGRTIEKDVYALFALNAGAGPTMQDGNPLFHAAHNNIVGTAAAPSVAAFDAIRVALGSQKDPGGNDYLDILAAIFLGPLSLGGVARVANNAEYDVDVTKFQVPNKVRGMFRDIVDTPRLSGTAWFAFADPSIEPVFEVAFLDGIQVPTIEQETNFRTDGLSWKVVHRYGVGAVGWRGAQKNAGV